MTPPSAPYCVHPSGSPSIRSHSRSVGKRIQPPSGSSSYQKAKGVTVPAKSVEKGSFGAPKLFRNWSCFRRLAASRIRKGWKGMTTGTRPPASREGPRSPSAAGSPPDGPETGGKSIGRGLNSISPARRPPKSATRKTRCRRASRGLAQYWASMILQARSGHPPRTIPAYAHRPEAGIGISASGRKARSTAR